VKITKIVNGNELIMFQKESDYENDSEPVVYIKKIKSLVFGDWNKIKIAQ
jgi:hypothetical protein